jgi:hypothetical protein
VVVVGCAVRTIQDESPLFIAPRLNGAWNAPYACLNTCGRRLGVSTPLAARKPSGGLEIGCCRSSKARRAMRPQACAEPRPYANSPPMSASWSTLARIICLSTETCSYSRPLSRPGASHRHGGYRRPKNSSGITPHALRSALSRKPHNMSERRSKRTAPKIFLDSTARLFYTPTHHDETASFTAKVKENGDVTGDALICGPRVFLSP